jgi:hypothetical protein
LNHGSPWIPVIVLGPLVTLRRTGYQGRSPWLVRRHQIVRNSKTFKPQVNADAITEYQFDDPNSKKHKPDLKIKILRPELLVESLFEKFQAEYNKIPISWRRVTNCSPESPLWSPAVSLFMSFAIQRRMTCHTSWSFPRLFSRVPTTDRRQRGP